MVGKWLILGHLIMTAEEEDVDIREWNGRKKRRAVHCVGVWH